MRVRYYDNNYDKIIMVEVIFRDKSDPNRALLMIPPQDKYECSAIIIAERLGSGSKTFWHNVNDEAYINVT